jgi:hypothetical protein
MSSDELIVKLVSDLSKEIGAVSASLKTVTVQGESRDSQLAIVLEQQSRILDEMGRLSREQVNQRQDLDALKGASSVIPPMRPPSPSLTTMTTSMSEALKPQNTILNRQNAILIGVFLTTLLSTAFATWQQLHPSH